MVAVKLLGLSLTLQCAAFTADAKARAIQLLAPDFHRSTLLRLLSKVHLPERHSVQELEAKGECLLVNNEGLAHRIRRAINQGLSDIEATLTLIGVIRNAAVSIQGAGEDGGQAQHLVHPSTVFP